MSQILKKKRGRAALLAGTAAAAFGATGVQANADEIVRATTAGEGVTNYDPIVTTTYSEREIDLGYTSDVAEVNALNSLIEAAARVANDGSVKVSEDSNLLEKVNITTADVENLRNLLRDYNNLRAQLNTQLENNVALTGRTDNEVNTREAKSTTSIADVNQKLSGILTEMRSVIDSNSAIIASNAANSTTASKELADLINRANETIRNAQKASLGSNDGILGIYDDIKRASDDSKAAGGVVVDNTETTKASAGAVDVKADKYTTVGDAASVAHERDRILEGIKKEAASNNSLTSDAASYKETALRNIDDINEWLKTEQERAKNIQEELAGATGAVDEMTAYKDRELARLNEIREFIQNSSKGSANSKAKLLEKVDAAIAAINASGVKTEVKATVNPEGVVDFGNIGRPTSEIDARQKEISDSITNAVNNHLDEVKSSNAAALDKIRPVISSNTEAITKFVEKVKAGGGGAQVDESLLTQIELYNNNSTYKNYVQNALSQTEEDVSNTLKNNQKVGNTTIWKVDPGTSVAQASAAVYQKESDNGFEDGYGSTMVRYADINKYTTVSGDGILATGSSEILTALKTGTGRGYLPGIINDIQQQHVDTGNPTFIVVSSTPTINVNLKDSFVYLDENGEAGFADQSLVLTLTDRNGKSIYQSLVDQGQKQYISNVLHVFALHVDPTSGQLVVGAGYIVNGNPDSGVADPGGGGGGGETGASTTNTSGLANYADKSNLYHTSSSIMYDLIDGLKLGFALTTDSKASAWASNAPLYVSDIDDGQYLTVSSASQRDIVTSGDISITQSGNNAVVKTKVDNNISGDRQTTLSSESVLVFGTAGGDGLTVEYGSIAHDRTGYDNIDIRLFAPFGVIGAPTITLDSVTADVSTFELESPTAIAHTDHSVTTTSKLELLKADPGTTTKPITDVNVEILIPTVAPTARPDRDVEMVKKEEVQERIAASNTAFVVRQLADDVKKVASGNSFLVKTIERDVVTASGNSLTVRVAEPTSIATASGNSMVVRVLDGEATVEITPAAQASVIKTPSAIANIANSVTAKAPTVTGNVVSMSVYADPAVASIAKSSMDEWRTALATKGLTLNYTLTSDINTLKQGVTLAIFDADNTTTKIANGADSKGVEADAGYEMNGLAGLMTRVESVVVVDADSNDKYNKSGTVTTAEVLRAAKYAIQVNTEALPDHLEQHTLAHEIGHVFGLDHDDDDALMTTYLDDEDFTGEITDKSATLAASYIINNFPTGTSTGVNPETTLAAARRLRELRLGSQSLLFGKA